MSHERFVPANPEAEQSVLGSVLIDPDAISKVAGILKPDDFYTVKNGWIFDACLILDAGRTPIDFVTLTDLLERRSQLSEVGGAAYVMDLINAVPTSYHAEHYARVVKGAATLRRLIRAGGQLAQLAYEFSGDYTDVKDLVLPQADAILFDAIGKDMAGGPQSLGYGMNETIDHIEEAGRRKGIIGVSTGFKHLDRVLGGLSPSDLIILAARPGAGKTGLALSIARNAARAGKQGAIFSLEMSREQLHHRLLAGESGIDSQRLRLGDIRGEDEWHRLMEAAGTLSALPLYVDDTPAINLAALRARCRQLDIQHGLDYVIVDYLTLVTTDLSRANRVAEVDYISKGLKNLARELNIPVIALAQISRAVENRMDKKPVLSDLRESGGIEQEADVVMFIYREDMYVEETDRQNIADIIVAKHRNGPVGTVSLFFRKELTQFRDLELRKDGLNQPATHAAYSQPEEAY